MMDASKEREIAEIILNADDIVISSHTGPDGDAIGSVCAMFMAAKNAGKNVIAVLEAIPYRFREIEGTENILFEIPKDFNIKTFIAIDCGSKARLGKFEEYFDGAESTINIDHHASNDYFGYVNLVDEYSSAASEMVFNILLSHNGFNIDKRIASALYAGILYDTGGFRHASASSGTYFAAGKLIDLGADFSAISNKILWTKCFGEIKILAVAINKMRREFDGRFIWTSILLDELKQAEAKPSDTDSVVDFCKSVEGCEIAAFIYQKDENEFKISMRCEPEYNVSVIAAKFGGGGHRNAAGATYHGALEECVEEVIKQIGNTLCGEVQLGRSN